MVKYGRGRIEYTLYPFERRLVTHRLDSVLWPGVSPHPNQHVPSTPFPLDDALFHNSPEGALSHAHRTVPQLSFQSI